MRIDRGIPAVLVIAALTGCTGSAETAVRLTVLYDERWSISELDVAAGGGEPVRTIAAHEVLVLIDDEWTGRELTLEVAGLRDGERTAFGRAVVTPVPGTEMSATLSLLPIACDALSAPEHGTIDGGDGLAGDVATYACGDGYVLTGNRGSNTRRCEPSGAWTGSEPSCSEVVSPCEPSPCSNGGTCEELDGSFACTCAAGYEGATCAMRVSCPALTAPANGSTDRTSGSLGDVVSYACEDGFVLVGSSERACGADGAWTGAAPSCEAIVSPCDPNPCANGGFCAEDGEGSFSCSCASGYEGSTCATRVACPTLSAPANGSVDRTVGSYGDVATYGCTTGYTLSGGSSARTCEASGAWSGSAPSCERLTTPCDPSPCMNGGTCTLDGATSFRCACQPGFSGATCESASPCPSLTQPAYGFLDRTTASVGQVATYSCRSGYYLWGNGGSPTRTCQADGQWTGSQPACSPTDGFPTWPLPGSDEDFPYSYTTRADTVLDDITGLEWQRAVPAGSYVHANASAYCEELVLDGRTDWRLPTRIELMSIIDFTRRPSIDPVAFPSTPVASNDYFWTSSRYSSDTTRGWISSFDYGWVGSGPLTNAYHVRCVRGGLVHAAQILGRFTIDEEDGTVADNFTGLAWQREPLLETFSQDEAYETCANDYMRLPTALELASIVHEKAYPPAFRDIVVYSSGDFWSTSFSAPERGYAVSSYTGTVVDRPNFELYRALCVR
jgi:hypothetical protein